ncbi:notch-regulated ankyrin repeat-containing protein [Moschus berezovskii]|nr:notch-regulated ankyrin repeat-containing protein [Moschus berezovskii]
MCPTGRAGRASSLREPGVLGTWRVRGQHSRSGERDWGSLPEPRPPRLRCQQRPNQRKRPSRPLGSRSAAGWAWSVRARSLEFPWWLAGAWEGRRRRRGPPPTRRHLAPSPAPPAASAPGRRTRPARPRPARALPNGRAAGARVMGAHCHANIKEVKGAPARRAGECSGACGGEWSRTPRAQGPGTRRRRPGPAGPASAAPAPVARPPGAAGCGGGPEAAAPGPQRPERPRVACGARGRRAFHAPRRAPRQPGARAEAAARAEPGPAPGDSMSQAELSTCSAPQTQRIFQEAVRKGNTQELQSLLQNMTNCEFNVNSFGPEGQTALHQSVIDGNLELVKLLVKFGADIRLANRDGWSALHIAAFGGHQDIVLYLITKAKYAGGGR